jgi:hypothetical protein
MNEERTVNDIKKEEEEQKVCIICKDPAPKMKMGKSLCEYHYDLSNDHKRGRG